LKKKHIRVEQKAWDDRGRTRGLHRGEEKPSAKGIKPGEHLEKKKPAKRTPTKREEEGTKELYI